MSQQLSHSAYSADELVTGEGVAVELPVASVPSRMASGAIDIAVNGIVLIICFAVFGLLGVGASDAVLRTLAILILVGSLVLLPMTVETLSRGKTLGKLIMGLRTVRDDGGPITSRHALTRALIGFVELYAFTGAPALFAAMSSSRSKRLGDMAAGTFVVSERTNLRLSPPPQMPAPLAAWAASADMAALPVRLSVAIRQFLGRTGVIDPVARDSLGRELTQAALTYVSPPPPSGIHHEYVLFAILADRRRRDSERILREDALRAKVIPPDPLAR